MSVNYNNIKFIFDILDERKKSSLPTIPTVNYTVGNRDTLTSVAARFDTTPSELTHLNRLNSSFIYPGQQLLVPDKSAKDNVSTSSTDDKTGGSSASGKSSPIERKLSAEEQSYGKFFISVSLFFNFLFLSFLTQFKFLVKSVIVHFLKFYVFFLFVLIRMKLPISV